MLVSLLDFGFAVLELSQSLVHVFVLGEEGRLLLNLLLEDRQTGLEAHKVRDERLFVVVTLLQLRFERLGVGDNSFSRLLLLRLNLSIEN